jgi:two-component system, sensor histidine kinase and response regulator
MDTILIVDDTPANLSVLLQCLGDAGYRVLVAEDGEEALDQIAHAAPDLVLLDVMMPGIDGFETCRRLRANPATRDLPVIFMTALTDTREKLIGFDAGGVDYITKPVQHEEALARVATHLQIRRLRRELAAELALKEKFMRIAAHDLRNPLCLIMMAGGVARRASADAAALRRALEDIDASARHMRGIIDTFLQLRAGDRSARLSLPAIVEAVIKQQTPAAEAKQQTIEYERPDQLPPVRGDATEVFQIVTNLLSNAVKFTPVNGQITVTVALAPNGVALRLAVADSGPGVPPDERERLFTEFAKLSPRPTAGEESHGVGLAIVKQLAEENHGRVGADFPQSGGSVFWCELPLAGM